MRSKQASEHYQFHDDILITDSGEYDQFHDIYLFFDKIDFEMPNEILSVFHIKMTSKH